MRPSGALEGVPRFLLTNSNGHVINVSFINYHFILCTTISLNSFFSTGALKTRGVQGYIYFTQREWWI